MANKKKSDWPDGVITRKKPSGIKPYYRFKAGGERALPVDRNSEAFAAAYEECRLLDRVDVDEVAKPKKEKTFLDAWENYVESEEFLKLSPLTKSRHTYYADTFLGALVKGKKTKWKEVPMNSPEAELLPLLRAYIKTAPADLPYRTACLLRLLYRIAIDQEEWGILRNLGNDLDVPKTASKGGHHKWTQDMLDRFERIHKDNPMALAAYGIARWLGNRLSDVARLQWHHLRIGWVKVGDEFEEEWTFNFNQKKGGTEMWLPVPEELKTILQMPELVESRHAGGAIIKNEWGVGFTIDSLGNKFFDWCDAANIPEGYRAHGLRANFAVELWTVSGGDLSLVQVAMGHKSPATTTIYLKDLIGNEDSADKIRAARARHKAKSAEILEFTSKRKKVS